MCPGRKKTATPKLDWQRMLHKIKGAGCQGGIEYPIFIHLFANKNAIQRKKQPIHNELTLLS
jgi:hypothetical protein